MSERLVQIPPDIIPKQYCIGLASRTCRFLGFCQYLSEKKAAGNLSCVDAEQMLNELQRATQFSGCFEFQKDQPKP